MTRTEYKTSTRLCGLLNWHSNFFFERIGIGVRVAFGLGVCAELDFIFTRHPPPLQLPFYSLLSLSAAICGALMNCRKLGRQADIVGVPNRMRMLYLLFEMLCN